MECHPAANGANRRETIVRIGTLAIVTMVGLGVAGCSSTSSASSTTVASVTTTPVSSTSVPRSSTTVPPATTPPTTAVAVDSCVAFFNKYHGINTPPPGFTAAQARTLVAESCTPAGLAAEMAANGTSASPAELKIAVGIAQRFVCPTNPGTKLCP